jgi:hypothetical protein
MPPSGIVASNAPYVATNTGTVGIAWAFTVPMSYLLSLSVRLFAGTFPLQRHGMVYLPT